MHKIINKIFTGDKYYTMLDDELEKIASKWQIRGYAYRDGNIDRQIIIDRLIKKDQCIFLNWSLILSFFAIIIFMIAIVLK